MIDLVIKHESFLTVDGAEAELGGASKPLS